MTRLRIHGFAALLALASCGRASPPAADAAAPTRPARQPAPNWISITVLPTSAALSADEQVAMVLEHAVSSVEGLTAMRSQLGEQLLVVSLAFENADDGSAMIAVQSAVAEARAQLPENLGTPMLHRHGRDEADAWLLLRSDVVSPVGLAAVAERTFDGLATLPGVREASSCGPRLRTVLEIDPQNMAAFGLGFAELRALVLAEQELVISAGIDPAAMLARVRARADVLTMREDTVSSCTAIAATHGIAVAVHLRYDPTSAAALRNALGNVRATLPPAIELLHEPLDDRSAGTPPRISIRAPAFDTLPWRDHPRASGAWMVIEPRDGSAKLVGLTDVDTARALAATLAALPDVTAVPETSAWASVVLIASDPARLERNGAALAAALERASPDGVWPEQAEAAPRRGTSVDRVRAATLGIARTEIDDALAAISEAGLPLGRHRDPPRRDVVLHIASDPLQPVPDVPLQATDGRVSLASLVTVSTEPGARQRSRCNAQPCIGFAVPWEVAASLDLPALGRELALAQGDYLAVLPRTP